MITTANLSGKAGQAPRCERLSAVGGPYHHGNRPRDDPEGLG